MNDELILDAIQRLGSNAYGVTIRRELLAQGHDLSYGELYVRLERLERAGVVTSRLGQATPERGNRPKRFYSIVPQGEQREPTGALKPA